jgi:hypothetical protein
MRRHEFAKLLLLAAIVLILAATLRPVTDARGGSLSACVICGSRGLADAILNVVLFLPLGAALALNGWRLSRACLAAFLLAAAIESAQLFIAGRDASLADAVFNTLGVLLAMVLLRTHPKWLHPNRRAASRLSLLGAVVAVGVFGLTGYLLQPSLPPSAYFGQWTPNLGHLEWYRGRVLQATLGARPLPSEQLEGVDEVRSLLSAGATLEVRTVAGPQTERLAPVFSVYDEQQREIFLLGADRDDLVFRYRTRATALRLDQPDLRLLGALRALAPGDTVTFSVHRTARGFRLSTDRGARREVGFAVGMGWALLWFRGAFPSWLVGLLSIGWIAGLVVPIGFWSRMRWESFLAVSIILLALGVIPVLTGLASTPATQFGGALGGFLAGVGLQFLIRETP